MHLRSLPGRPSLEFERKRARKIVRERNGEIILAEAQLQVAREYGFSSWRKLKAYYTTWERHHRVGPVRWQTSFREAEQRLERMTEELETRKALSAQPPDIFGTAASIAAFIPRLYGAADAEIFASDLSVDELRLVIARNLRFDSWDDMVREANAAREKSEKARAARAARSEPPRRGPLTFESFYAGETLQDRIEEMFRKHPVLREDPNRHVGFDSISWYLLLRELINEPSAPEILSWMTSLGVDVKPNLNQLLVCEGLRRTRATQEIRALLDWGADTGWLLPSGYNVLEHAIVRYCNGEAVDLIAQKSRARNALWTAAGLGHAAVVSSYYTKRGVLSEAARRDRPDFVALESSLLGVSRPGADDHTVLFETFMLAGFNSRLAVLDVLLERGYPIDFTPYEHNLVHWCAEFSNVEVLEFLKSRGANLHFKVAPSYQTALEIATMVHNSDASDSRTARILNLLS